MMIVIEEGDLLVVEALIKVSLFFDANWVTDHAQYILNNVTLAG